MDNKCDLIIYMLVVLHVDIMCGHHLWKTILHFPPLYSPHPFPSSCCVLLYFTSPVPSLLYSHPSLSLPFPLHRPPDQGEAICSSNPSLILAQRSWKMYSRQTVGRCRLVPGPQHEPGSALMEHYFQPLHRRLFRWRVTHPYKRLVRRNGPMDLRGVCL